MSETIADFHQPETEALLLDLLDMPISFHRCFVGLTGKVTAALLLSYLWWSGEDDSDHDGWISKALDEIRDETGLSKDELATARRILRELAIVEEHRHGMPPALAFRVNHSRVADLLAGRVFAKQQSSPTGATSDVSGRQRV